MLQFLLLIFFISLTPQHLLYFSHVISVYNSFNSFRFVGQFSSANFYCRKLVVEVLK